MSSHPPASSATLATLAKRLLVALRGERQLHQQLLRLTAEERTAIATPAILPTAEGPLPLERIVAEKERTVVRLADLETTRGAISGALAGALYLPRDTRLAELLPLLAPPVAALLQAERTALLASAQALAEANAANAALLKDAIATTRLTADYFRSTQSPAYDSDGRAAAAAPRPLRLDFQA